MAWLDGLRAIAVLVYLVHHVLIQLLSPLLTDLGRRLPAPAEIPVVAAYLGLLLGISWLTHRFVEVPGQRLGRRWARWMTIRWGPTPGPPLTDRARAGLPRRAPTPGNGPVCRHSARRRAPPGRNTSEPPEPTGA